MHRGICQLSVLMCVTWCQDPCGLPHLHFPLARHPCPCDSNRVLPRCDQLHAVHKALSNNWPFRCELSSTSCPRCFEWQCLRYKRCKSEKRCPGILYTMERGGRENSPRPETILLQAIQAGDTRQQSQVGFAIAPCLRCVEAVVCTSEVCCSMV